MASPPSDKPSRTELDYRLSFKKADSFVVILRELIKWGGIVLVVRYGYLSIAALAGHTTFADVGIKFLSNLRVSDSIMYILTGGSIAYGLGQRRSRRRNIERMAESKNELEKLIHSERTSSNITKSGTTRPGDRI